MKNQRFKGRKVKLYPQDSSKQGLVTPPTTKAHASGEEQEEEISPNTLEAAKTLSKVASLKSRSIDKGRRYKRRKESTGKKVVSSLDFQEETNTGTETPLNPVPVAMKTPSVATYKIIKQGEKGVYQIVREDGTDIVYINFGAMLKSISRDDLIELYKIVMNRYGLDGPEDKLEKGFWKCLRIMFEEPLSTYSIWSEIGQQKIVSWRYYPLSSEICQTMLKMKLLDGKMNEDCYRLLKMIEKQAG
ncbi:hypothetical protein Tco_1412075, partial [Tanacetum coccineum]